MRLPETNQGLIKVQPLLESLLRWLSRRLGREERGPRRGTCIEICRMSRCLCPVVWSAMVTHSALSDSSRKTTSLSFVAFERLIEADLGSSRNRSQLPMRIWVPDGPTTQTPVNVERLKGARAPLHKRYRQRDILLEGPCQREFPELDTTWYEQQPVCDWPNPSSQIKAQGPSKRR